jgi:MFS family permease
VSEVIRPDPTQDLRRARIGVTTLFVLLGLGTGSLASRVPAIKGQLHLSTGSLGLALLGTAVGSVLSTPISGWVLARVAPRRWIAFGLVPFTVFLPLATLAGGRWSLLAVLVGMGFGMGCVDVAMNTEATRIQTLLGRRILSGIHATFSLGALTGAGIGAIAAAASIGFGTQFVVVNAVVLVIGSAAVLLLPDAPAVDTPADSRTGDSPTDFLAANPADATNSAAGDAGDARNAATANADADAADSPLSSTGRATRAASHSPRRQLAALAVVSFAALLSEGAANDWSAVYIHTSLGATAAVGALGYAAFSATMVVGRFGGDRVTTRWGPARVVRIAATLGACSLGVALLVGKPAVAIAGFALLGFGLAVTFPLAVGAASGIGTAGPSVALVTSAGYLGFLCGPPVIGGLATITSLPAALGLPATLCLLLAVLAGPLGRGDPTRRAPAHDEAHAVN